MWRSVASLTPAFEQHRTEYRHGLRDPGAAIFLQRAAGAEIRRQQQLIDVAGLEKRQDRRDLLRVGHDRDA